MTIFVLIDVAAADGTSLSNNHATGSIVALASACIAAATAVAPPRRSDRERSNVTLYNVDCDNEDNDDDNDDDDKQMNSTESLRPSRKKKKKKQKKKKKKKRSHSNDDYVIDNNDVIDDDEQMNSTKSSRSSRKKKKRQKRSRRTITALETEKVVYEEVDVEEEDNDDEPFAYSAPTHRKTNKSKKQTKTDAESLAIELLDGRLKPLNQPSKTNWLDIVPTLDSIFEELEPSVKDELVHQLCIHLVVDVDYDKNILLLERFFADIDQDGVCINDNISCPTFKLLSLIYNAY
jgi:hypothetical protein